MARASIFRSAARQNHWQSFYPTRIAFPVRFHASECRVIRDFYIQSRSWSSDKVLAKTLSLPVEWYAQSKPNSTGKAFGWARWCAGGRNLAESALAASHVHRTRLTRNCLALRIDMGWQYVFIFPMITANDVSEPRPETCSEYSNREHCAASAQGPYLITTGTLLMTKCLRHQRRNELGGTELHRW
jgi:hypothetical protein